METFRSFCLRLLQDEALEACVDPVPVAGDPGGPAGAAARAHRRPVAARARDPRQPGAAARQLRRRASTGSRTRWSRRTTTAPTPSGCSTRRRATPRAPSAARELEFARLYADHDRLLAERGALDYGDLVLRAFQLLHERPHVRERVARPLPARARGRVRRHQLRPGHAAAPADRGAPPGDARGRGRPLPRGAARGEGGQARAQLPLGPAHPRRGRRGGAREEAHRRERRARALLALPLGARPGPGRGRGGRAADRLRRAARGDLRAGALGAERGRGDRIRPGGARGARRASAAPPPTSSEPRSATCSPGCARSPTRTTPARSCGR